MQKNLEAKLNYQFKNKNLLNEALIHSSFQKSQFQILEFLGDRVLGLVIASFLYKKDKAIKAYANEFANLVNTEALYKIAKFWEIEKYLNHDIQLLSKKVLADCVEAIIGAIYLDSGYESVFAIIYEFWNKNLLKDSKKIEPKMFLQEFSQSKNLGIPVYELIEENGSDHDKNFTIKVSIPTLGEALGFGKSKHIASKNAAENFIKKYENQSL